MADVNHPIVSGLTLPTVAIPIMRSLVSGVGALTRTAAQAAAAGAAITAVDTLAGDGDQGVVSFNLDLSRDDTRINNVSEMTTQDITNSLRIEQRPDLMSMSPEAMTAFLERDADGTAALNELLLRVALSDAESDVIRNVVEQKVEMSEPDGNAFAALVPDSLLEAASNSDFASLVDTSSLSETNRRRVPNSTLDGRRVSREYSEFQYCRTSGQIGTALTFLTLWDRGELANVNEDELPEGYGQENLGFGNLQQDDVSYGQFADMFCFRRFIALRRGLVRKVRSANVRCILDLTNPRVDPDILMIQILAGIDHNDVIEEINRTVTEQVRFGSNRAECEARGGATRAIADRREQVFDSAGQGDQG